MHIFQRIIWTKLGLIWFWISQMIRKTFIVLMKTEREEKLSYTFQYVICVIFDSIAPCVADNYIIYNLKSVLQPKTSPILLKDKNWGQETIRIFYEGKSNLFSISLLHMPFSKCNPLNATSCRVKLGKLTVYVDKAYLMYFLHISWSHIRLVEYIYKFICVVDLI